MRLYNSFRNEWDLCDQLDPTSTPDGDWEEDFFDISDPIPDPLPLPPPAPPSCRTFATTSDVMRLQLPLITPRVLNALSHTYDFISAFIWQHQLPDPLVDPRPLIAGWISRSSVMCATLLGTQAKMLTPFQTCNSMSLHAL
jgi:hypothetical protein